MSARLVFLSGSLAGTTFEIPDTEASLGRGTDCDVQFDGSDGVVSGIHAHISARDGRVNLRDEQSRNGTFVDGQPVAAAELTSGQIVTFGRNGPAARIEIGDTGAPDGKSPTTWDAPVATQLPGPVRVRVGGEGAAPSGLTGVYHLARQRAAGPSGERPSQTAVIKAFVQLAQERSTRRFQALLAVVALAGLVTVATVYVLGERKAADLQGRLIAMSDELAMQGQARAALETQLSQLATTADASQQAAEALARSVEASQAELDAQRQRTDEQRAVVEQDRRFGPTVTERFAAGVGLIEYQIGWRNDTLGWLRLRGTPDGTLRLTTDGGDQMAFLGTNQCTGFLVDEAGWILTNRHCVDLTFADQELVSSATLKLGQNGEAVFTPAIAEWRISFPPGTVLDIDPDTIEASEEHDLGLFRATSRPDAIPVLPLARNQPVVAGETVVLLAYPGGTLVTARRRGLGSLVDSSLRDALEASVNEAIGAFATSAGVGPLLKAIPADREARAAFVQANPVIQLLLSTREAVADRAVFDALSRARQVQPDVSGNISVSGVRPGSISFHTLGGIGGSSGGPLISTQLSVIGVNHAGFAETDRGSQYQQNEAVPVAFVLRFLPTVIK